MNYLQAIVLGLVQGLAEFLPVSSSGHLVIFKDILGLGEIPLAFDITLHLATLFAVVIVFRQRIGRIIVAVWRWIAGKATGKAPGMATAPDAGDENLALVVPLILATIVTGVMGLLIQKFLPPEGARAASAELLITAVVLAATAFIKPGDRGPTRIGKGRALFIGFAQGLGVFSGISRSGFTIAAGMATGLRRDLAGEFSFLLSIPAIIAAFLLSLKDASGMMANVQAGPLLLASAVAFVSGLVALKLLMRVVRSGKIAWFALYLVPVGLAGLFLF